MSSLCKILYSSRTFLLITAPPSYCVIMSLLHNAPAFKVPKLHNRDTNSAPLFFLFCDSSISSTSGGRKGLPLSAGLCANGVFAAVYQLTAQSTMLSCDGCWFS